MKLKEKIKQINLSHLNQKIKRQNSTIMRQQIIIKDIKLISLLKFAAVDSLGSSSMCISNTSKMDLIRGAQCCRPIPRLLKL
jgi:hypothetical protein